MNEEILQQIERNTKRTAQNSAFITWLSIAGLIGGVGVYLINNF